MAGGGGFEEILQVSFVCKFGLVSLSGCFRREGIRPTLELETKNGAILADEDLVSMLFPMGSMHAEELKATILKRTLPPLLDRYDEACVQNGTGMLRRHGKM